MGKSSNEKIADKIVALLADGRISQTDWRLSIPFYVTSHNKMIIANAKNLADGINEEIENKEIGIPNLAEQKLLAVFGDTRLTGEDFAMTGFYLSNRSGQDDELANALIARNLVLFAESIIVHAINSGEKDYAAWAEEVKKGLPKFP